MEATVLARPTVHDIPTSLKSTLVDDAGVPYREFRKTLRPRYALVWAHLLTAYVVLAAVLVGLSVWDPGVAGAIGGALVIGYTIHYISNFLHESAHYNLLSSRKANDAATNVLMSWLFGTSAQLYRPIHFVHHRALGTTMDSETSYFDPLKVRYLVEGLLGVRLLRVLGRWRGAEKTNAKTKDDPATSGRKRLVWLGVAALVNGGLVVGLALTGNWEAAVAWVLGELMVFPFLASLRQTLEHRAEDAHADVDYREVDHGAVNRLFGDGPVASTLGSAGFNRHALHHWEPQVSYTRLKDLERWLARTELAPQIAERQTSYHHTLLRLLEL